MIPPPNPVRAPTNPAKSDATETTAVNSKMFKWSLTLHGDALFLKTQRRANLPASTIFYGIYGYAMTQYLRPGCKLRLFQR